MAFAVVEVTETGLGSGNKLAVKMKITVDNGFVLIDQAAEVVISNSAVNINNSIKSAAVLAAASIAPSLKASDIVLICGAQ